MDPVHLTRKAMGPRFRLLLPWLRRSVAAMTGTRQVQIFLEDGLLTSARAGSHNFLNLLTEVLSERGMGADFQPMDARGQGTGRSLIHMKAPASPNGLVFRRVYHYPFWQIEQAEKRWMWDVARAAFDPGGVDGKQARRFQRFWRGRLFPGLEHAQGDAIYVPLQGRIAKHRSFQSCAPLDMVAQVMAATDRPVTIGLHPKETYTDDDLARLREVAGRATIQMGGMETALPACHAIVTMNSAVAFNGYFFGKPAHLFAEIDFHHIAQKKAPADLADALENPEPKPYAKYLHWFWQTMSINAGREDAKDKIRARLDRFGWL